MIIGELKNEQTGDKTFDPSTSVSFKTPTGIAINQRNGNIVVSDSYNHRIQILDDNGHLLTMFGSQGNGLIMLKFYSLLI